MRPIAEINTVVPPMLQMTFCEKIPGLSTEKKYSIRIELRACIPSQVCRECMQYVLEKIYICLPVVMVNHGQGRFV
jgi:hypothetical protein